MSGLSGPSRPVLTAAEGESVKALVARAGNAAPVASLHNDPARVQGVFYGQQEGTGTTLADTGGFGPSITVGGTTAGIWANAGSLTHHSAGNTIRLTNLQYADSLIDMRTDCSILVGMDLFMTAWPTITETMWGLHRNDTTNGGVRLVMASASVGRFGLYYRANGIAEVETVGGAPSSFLNRWVPTLVELRVLTSVEVPELQMNLWLDGQVFRSRRGYPLGTPPPPNSGGGLSFSGYGAGPIQPLGSGSSGARTRNVFAFRHSGVDRNIGGRLAAHMAANTTLPTWLTRF